LIVKKILHYSFHFFLPVVLAIPFIANSSDYRVLEIHGRVIKDGALLGKDIEYIGDGGYLRTFRDSSIVFKKGSFFYKVYPYTKVLIKEGSVKLEYGKISRSKSGNFEEIHFLIFPKPAQGRATKIFLSTENNHGTWKAMVHGKGYKSRIELYRDGYNLYSGYFAFDVKARPDKYWLSVMFEKDDVVSNFIFPFYLRTLKPERGVVYLQEEDLEILKPSREKKVQIQELRDILSRSRDEKMWTERFIFPVNEIKVISKFGKKRIYLLNKKYMFTRFHRGVDLKAKRGQEVMAPNTGIVVMAKRRITTGNTVVIDHGRGVYSLLFHLDSITVKEGDRVDRATVVGTAGDSGFAGGVHVHWSVVVNGIYVDPEDWIKIKY